MNNRKIWLVLLIIFLFLAGAAGGYFLLHKFAGKDKSPPAESRENLPAGAEEVITLRISYPIDNRLQPVEKKVARRTKQTTIADAVIEEYLKGPGNGSASQFPQNVKVLGIYKDAAQVLYVDLSDEVRRNFQGDALTEYLLLKGFYESLISNLQDVQDVKILVEGKEAETLGGHFYLKYPLKNAMAYDYKGDLKVSHE